MNQSLTSDIKHYINRSVLCWLATSSKDNQPNVSPKEVFKFYGESSIIIANIASPGTVKNIQENGSVCVSFVDVLVQKGYQIKGTARIVSKSNPAFIEMKNELEKLTMGKYPFATITEISIITTKRILAPSYMLYPETTEGEQIENARKAYNL